MTPREIPALDAVLVIAKAPVPGRVKTRLVPPLTHVEAARLAEAALADTLRIAGQVPARRHILALDGTPGGWLPAGWRCVDQGDGELDRRLVTAFGHADGPALLIGMDTPQLRAEQLAGFDPHRFDACLGLAIDGGYWAIGLADPAQAAALIGGVPMSCTSTGARQLRRLLAYRLRVQPLDRLEDVDTYAAAIRVAAECGAGRFARAVAAVRRAA